MHAASVENNARSAVIDPDKIRIRDYPLTPMKHATDAIIYETSVRDFTMQKGIGVTKAW